MVTTSSDRGFQVPTVAGDSGVWGNELNATLGGIDSILGGSITLQSSAAMSVTLSSSQAQVGRIVVQGNLPSNFTLTFASSNYANGNYQVWNNSSAGGGNVFCQTLGGGATCLVPQGSMRLVNCDGINAQFADNQATAAAVPSYANKFRNPGMDVIQRYGGAYTPGAQINSGDYTADGWLVTYSGGGPTWSQQYNANIRGNALRLSGVSAGMTSLALAQRIESSVAAQLLAKSGSQPITIQFTIYNSSGASFTPQLSTFYPSAIDNWASSNSDLAAVSLQPCPNNTLTTVAYTFTPSALAARGYHVNLVLGNALNNSGGYIDISYADIRPTPGATIGLNSAPPLPELRPIAMEYLYCCRYFFAPQTGWGFLRTSISGAAGSGTSTLASGWFTFPVPMRVVPTLNNWTHNAGVNGSIGTPANASISNIGYGWTLVPTLNAGTAEMYTTGGWFDAELR